MKIVWHGEEVKNKVHGTLLERMTLIGVLGQRDIKKMLGKAAGSKKAGYPTPSAPGEPPHWRTGELKRKISYEVEDGRVIKTRVGTNTPYAKWLELGTQTPHVIRPKKAKVLSWIDSKTGKRVFAKKVTIPPLAARPFLRPWLDGSRQDIRRILGRKMRGEK